MGIRQMSFPRAGVLALVLALPVAALIGLTESTCACLTDELSVKLMKRSLRNLVHRQTEYSEARGTYAASLSDLEGWYPLSHTVAVTIGTVTETGWNATAAGPFEVECGIFMGDAPAPVEGAVEGEPTCRMPEEKGLLTDVLEALGRKPKF